MDETAAVLDALPDATLVVDANGTVALANRRAESLLGYGPDELDDRPIGDVLDAVDGDVSAVIRVVSDGTLSQSTGSESTNSPTGSGSTDLRSNGARRADAGIDAYARRVDGTGVPVTVRLGAFDHEGGRRTLVTISDASREREHEARLNRRSETLEALHRATQELLKTTEEAVAADAAVEYVDDVLGLRLAAIWLYDDDARVLVPAAWTEFADEIVGDHPAFDVDGESLIAGAFDSGEPRYVTDTHAEPNRYNPETPVRSELIVPLGRYGVLCVGATVPDAFEEADRTVARLWAATVTMVLVRIERERQLREREAEITRERDRFEEFASLVSHDLRNPLNVASGHLELALEEVDSPELRTVSTSIERMEAIIDDVLTLARQGEAVDDAELIDLTALVADCWETVDTADATVSVTSDVTVSAARGRLARLLENLFRNSVEHGSTGSRPKSDDAIEHWREDVRITVGPLPDGDGFYVADDGPGIDPERRETVFETGYTTNPDGTGFGLRIVSEIADAHGWSVELVESDGGGARFEFRGAEVVD